MVNEAIANPDEALGAIKPAVPAKPPGEFADPLNPTPEELRATRLKDYEVGAARGQDLFKEGSLGRLGTNEDMASILQRRREGAGGFTPQQQDLMRAQQLASINSATQGNMRALKGAQGASGIQGGLANSQLAGALGQGAALRNSAEVQMQLANIQQQQQGLQNYQDLAQQMATYDIGQKNKETYGQYSTGISEQALGSADRGAALARAVSKDNAGQQVAVQSSGGKK